MYNEMVSRMSRNVTEGIQTARLNGKQIGQKPGAKLNVKKKAPAMERYVLFFVYLYRPRSLYTEIPFHMYLVPQILATFQKDHFKISRKFQKRFSSFTTNDNKLLPI